MPDAQSLSSPLARLRETLATCQGGLLVAMSAGVDSCTLAVVASQVLGDQVQAVTLDAESTARAEIEEAVAFARRHDLRHELVAHSELADPLYVKNDASRCYHCRKNMGSELQALAGRLGVDRIAMGVVTDDLGDHRPGIQAARQAGIWFPYVEADISKKEVRAIAAELGLEVHDKPSNACLSSRIAYGLEVTEDRLRQVEAAEQAVRRIARVAQVRVRHHGEVARIEVAPEERHQLIEHAEAVVEHVEAAGFTFVALDLLGYKTGSMNAALGQGEHEGHQGHTKGTKERYRREEPC